MDEGPKRSNEEEPAAYSVGQENSISQPQRPAPAERGALAHGEPLIPGDVANEFRRRWETIQTRFVDDPRHAVEDANQLVDEVTGRVVETFTSARTALEDQWSHGDDVTTEELRVVLQRYRSFFDRLLKTGETDTQQ